VADTVVGENPDPHAAGEDPNRRDFIHIAAGAAAVGAVGALAWPFIDQMNPSADTLALASVDFDLTKVALGQQVTIKWRGKPLFVRRRTEAEIAAAVAPCVVKSTSRPWPRSGAARKSSKLALRVQRAKRP
jgi:ubiquinol-cytochrome c reductase iron-sulfur subunit